MNKEHIVHNIIVDNKNNDALFYFINRITNN